MALVSARMGFLPALSATAPKSLVTGTQLYATAKAATAPVVTAVVGGACGAEPARKVDGAGVARFVDAAAGAAWVACEAAKQIAAEKAFYDRIVAKQAGGADGCGPDVSTVYNSGSQYTGPALRAAWAACRAPVAAPPPAAPQPSSTVAAPQVVQAPQAGASSSPPLVLPAPVMPEPSTVQQAEPAAAVKVEAPASKTSPGVYVAIGGTTLAVGLGLYFLLR